MVYRGCGANVWLDLNAAYSATTVSWSSCRHKSARLSPVVGEVAAACLACRHICRSASVAARNWAACFFAAAGLLNPPSYRPARRPPVGGVVLIFRVQ